MTLEGSQNLDSIAIMKTPAGNELQEASTSTTSQPIESTVEAEIPVGRSSLVPTFEQKRTRTSKGVTISAIDGATGSSKVVEGRKDVKRKPQRGLRIEVVPARGAAPAVPRDADFEAGVDVASAVEVKAVVENAGGVDAASAPASGGDSAFVGSGCGAVDWGFPDTTVAARPRATPSTAATTSTSTASQAPARVSSKSGAKGKVAKPAEPKAEPAPPSRPLLMGASSIHRGGDPARVRALGKKAGESSRTVGRSSASSSRNSSASSYASSNRSPPPSPPRRGPARASGRSSAASSVRSSACASGQASRSVSPKEKPKPQPQAGAGAEVSGDSAPTVRKALLAGLRRALVSDGKKKGEASGA
jgi:hypothetical protein